MPPFIVISKRCFVCKSKESKCFSFFIFFLFFFKTADKNTFHYFHPFLEVGGRLTHHKTLSMNIYNTEYI